MLREPNYHVDLLPISIFIQHLWPQVYLKETAPCDHRTHMWFHGTLSASIPSIPEEVNLLRILSFFLPGSESEVPYNSSSSFYNSTFLEHPEVEWPPFLRAMFFSAHRLFWEYLRKSATPVHTKVSWSL